MSSSDSQSRARSTTPGLHITGNDIKGRMGLEKTVKGQSQQCTCTTWAGGGGSGHAGLFKIVEQWQLHNGMKVTKGKGDDASPSKVEEIRATGKGSQMTLGQGSIRRTMYR